jgi:hypothetical protein
MNGIDNFLNNLGAYLVVHHRTPGTWVSSGLCALASLNRLTCAGEGALKLAGVIKDPYATDNLATRYRVFEKFSWDAAAFSFYALCASNYVHGSAKFGAIVFNIYSGFEYMLSTSKADIYITSRVIGNVLEFSLTKLVWPPVRETAKITYEVLRRIPLPNNPVWVGVALLAGSIGITYFWRKSVPALPAPKVG